jgi:hypothetical protein
MQAAVPVSVDEGFAGRIALHSLPQSQPFYRRALEEDGCVITVVGSELVKAMNFEWSERREEPGGQFQPVDNFF